MNIEEPRHDIDRALAQTRAHHVQLSAMADVKANIMLTLASLLVTFSFRYLSDPILRWPVIVLILFCLLTILMAAYAVMPKGSSRNYRPSKESRNMLFFGNFVNMGVDEYMQEMERVLKDHNRVYEEQVREVYELGLFLGKKKYRFIRYAYLSFIAGMVACGVTFVIAEAVILSQS